jgi:ketosteroid isomerase-like protein
MYVADDFWQTTPEGVVQNKTQYLAALKATKDTDMADEYSVRFFGDVAIMTHRGTVKGEKPLQYRSTHVWVNRGGKWQIVAHHSSDIAAPTAKPGVSPAAADSAPAAAAPAKKSASPSALSKP